MDTPLKLLYVCTHNRCRSILSEAITNRRARGRIVAMSAGSNPAGAVHPLTLQALEAAGYSTQGLRSKSWDEAAAFVPDLVITVCDSAAREVCPVWIGRSLKVHWGLADPSAVAGSDADKEAAFRAAIAQVERRVDALLAVPFERLEPDALLAALDGVAAL